MQKHSKIYLEGAGYQKEDWIPCEICEKTAVDIHHIEARGMGGTKTEDTFDNLMAVCRKCHIDYGDYDRYKEMLKRIHHLRFRNLDR